jgi:MYXO-CTERM domain-containing protein
MMSFYRFLVAATAAALLGQVTQAQAGTAAPPLGAGTYSWSGTCIDCPLNGAPSPASATFVVGDPNDSSTWSFTFRSSNFNPDLESTSVNTNFSNFAGLNVPTQQGQPVWIVFNSISRAVPNTIYTTSSWSFQTGVNPDTNQGITWRLGEDNDVGFVSNGWTFTPTSAVPEPSSWVMALAGLGALGVVLRRRRNGSAA